MQNQLLHLLETEQFDEVWDIIERVKVTNNSNCKHLVKLKANTHCYLVLRKAGIVLANSPFVEFTTVSGQLLRQAHGMDPTVVDTNSTVALFLAKYLLKQDTQEAIVLFQKVLQLETDLSLFCSAAKYLFKADDDCKVRMADLMS